MPVRPAIKLGVGGALSVDVAEPGALTACAVTIYDETNTAVVSAAAATAVGSRLTYSLSAGVVNALGQYRALWAYTANGVPCERQQLFDVVRSVLRPTLTQAGLLDRYPLLAGVGGRGSMQQAIDAAWVDVFEAVEAAGNRPNRIIDPRPLEAPHAAFAAYRFARNLEAGSAQTGGQWQAWALDCHAEAMSLLKSALQHLAYDANDDGAVSPGEQQQNRTRKRLSR